MSKAVLKQKIIGLLLMLTATGIFLFLALFSFQYRVAARILAILFILSLTSILFWAGLVIFTLPQGSRVKEQD